VKSNLVHIRINGAEHAAKAGLPLAQVLSALDPTLRVSPREQTPRGMFCGMGLCFECMVEVDGIRRRSCLTLVSAGMDVRTGSREADQ